MGINTLRVYEVQVMPSFLRTKGVLDTEDERFEFLVKNDQYTYFKSHRPYRLRQLNPLTPIVCDVFLSVYFYIFDLPNFSEWVSMTCYYG